MKRDKKKTKKEMTRYRPRVIEGGKRSGSSFSKNGAGKKGGQDGWLTERRAGGILLFGGLLFVGIALSGLAFYLLTHYEVTTAYVEGNVHYSSEEIQQMVMEGRLGDNSLYLSLKYRNRGVEDVPFVETMDVDILSADTIKITVYEKALAGYVEHLGRYMYFDKDGVVVESSQERTLGIPQVSGLSFDHVVMYEALPVANGQVFADILDITQLLNKYGIRADRIYFAPSGNKTLYFGEARVNLGSNENIDEKIMLLQTILPDLEGKKGTLRLDNYTEGTKNVTTFKKSEG